MPITKALALFRIIKSPDSKGSYSALLQGSRTGCHSRGGSLRKKIPVVFFNCRSTTVCLFTTALSSGFSKPTNPSQKLPRKCVKPNLWVLLLTRCLWVAGAGGTGPPKVAASQGGFSKGRMQNSVGICSASWNERH